MPRNAYVESEVGGHVDNATQAWMFDLDGWGVCGQGFDERSALRDLAARTGHDRFVVVERIVGDEKAFGRDLRPATASERTRTQEILDDCRARTIELIASAPDAELDFDDLRRELPAWATWRTPRKLAWHIVDTESRYYLPAIGVTPRPPADDLPVELRQSAEHVRAAIAALPADLAVTNGSETWTTTKVLRRLAWHERGELAVLEQLLELARRGGTVKAAPCRTRGERVQPPI